MLAKSIGKGISEEIARDDLDSRCIKGEKGSGKGSQGIGSRRWSIAGKQGVVLIGPAGGYHLPQLSHPLFLN